MNPGYLGLVHKNINQHQDLQLPAYVISFPANFLSLCISVATYTSPGFNVYLVSAVKYITFPLECTCSHVRSFTRNNMPCLAYTTQPCQSRRKGSRLYRSSTSSTLSMKEQLATASTKNPNYHLSPMYNTIMSSQAFLRVYVVYTSN